MNIGNRFVILSGELVLNNIIINKKRSDRLENMIKDCNMHYKPIKGCYKGITEKSFLVIVKNEDEINTVKGFAFNIFKQDSILLQDSNGMCYLEYSNGTCKSIGKFKHRDNFDAYSIIDNKSYIVG